MFVWHSYPVGMLNNISRRRKVDQVGKCLTCRRRQRALSVPIFSKAICWRYMKKFNQRTQSNSEQGSSDYPMRLLIESLAELVNKQRIDLLQQGKEILGMLQELIESVDIIAR